MEAGGNMYGRTFLTQSPIKDVVQKYFPTLRAFDGHLTNTGTVSWFQMEMPEKAEFFSPD